MAGAKSLRNQGNPLEMFEPLLLWRLQNAGVTRAVDDHEGQQQLCRRTSLSLQNMLCVLWVEEPEKEAAQALQSSEDH